MYYQHQTLVKKSDGSLWILNAIDGEGTMWDWGGGIIGDENGNFEKVNYKDLMPIKDPFGQPQPGTPQKHENHPVAKKPYMTPDVSLKKFIEMTEEQKEEYRRQASEKTMEKFEEGLKKAIAAGPRNYHTSSVQVSVHHSGDIRYRISYLLKRFEERADHVFPLGGLHIAHHPKTIFVFDGVAFLYDGGCFIRMDDLNIEGLVGLVNFLKESNYQPRPPLSPK